MDRHPLSPGGNTLVILDTCVLLPSRLSDVLFDLMLEGLYFAYWTGDVEAEFLRNWPQVHPDASKSGAKRLKAFQRATNNGHLITGYDDTAGVRSVFGQRKIDLTCYCNRSCCSIATNLTLRMNEAEATILEGIWSAKKQNAAMKNHCGVVS
jgi:hypothetical protein